MLIAPHNTAHSCSRHGVAAARLPIGTARQRYYLFQKHLLCLQYIHSFSHCGCFWKRCQSDALARNLVTTVQIYGSSHCRDILPAPGCEIPAIRSAPSSLASLHAAELFCPSALQRYLWNIICDSSDLWKITKYTKFHKNLTKVLATDLVHTQIMLFFGLQR